MTAAEPLWIVLGAGVAVLVLVGLWSRARRRRRLAEFFGGPRAARRLTGTDLQKLPVGRMLLLGLAAVGLGAAASGPVSSSPEAPPPSPTARVVLALDVSASMQGTDVAPTRLGRGVEIARELLAGLEGQRVGLLLFAGKPYPLAPPTPDHAVLEYLLGGVAPDVVSMEDPGTLLSEGIRAAGALFGDVGPDEPRAVVLVSDGEAGEEDVAAVTAAAGELAEREVDLHAVGVGTAAGSELVLPVGYQRGGRLTDASGEPVVSTLREDLLRRIAGAGGGRYVDGADAGGVSALRRALAAPPAPREPAEPSSFLPGVDPVVWLAGAALLLLVAESLLDVRLPGRAPSPAAKGRGSGDRRARRSG